MMTAGLKGRVEGGKDEKRKLRALQPEGKQSESM
jgi:hypothetical protein